MKRIFREYEEKDFAAIVRIWEECGWLEEKMDDTVKEIIRVSEVVVGEINGNVEASAMATKGEVFYKEIPIKANVINAVTVSIVARKNGLGGRSLAKLLAKEAKSGVPVSFLGMFEQGFYDKLGYGSGSYFKHLHLDPADLKVDFDHRIPRKLSIKDYQIVHSNRLERQKMHGRLSITSELATKSEMKFMKKSFGLGYFDEKGKLTHHIWINPKNTEFGPYEIVWMAYKNREQFLELLSLISSLGDQVRETGITEPADIQLIDFLRKPIRNKALRKGGKYENNLYSYIYWQLRMLDPQACIENTHLDIKCEFNLRLTDPIEKYLDKDESWKGCGGEYTVRLGQDSTMSRGFTAGLPLMKAGVGAFSRMWLSVKPASGLAVSDDLKADEKLLKLLDKAFCMPEPHLDWWV